MARTRLGGGATTARLGSGGIGRGRLDAATLVGLVSGFGLIALATTMGSSPLSFLNLPAFLIVFGGTLGVTTISFSLGEILRTQRVIAKALFEGGEDARRTTEQMLQLADLARREGVLALQDRTRLLSGSPFALKAFELLLDGIPADEIDALLRHDVDQMTWRHANSAAVLRKAAEVSPAMGLIGTLIGLVQMLGNLDDPATIGPSMAVALLTTFYGAILSTMLFGPLASKLERNSREEATVRRIVSATVRSIARRENPRRLEVLVNAMLPPDRQVRYFR